MAASIGVDANQARVRTAYTRGLSTFSFHNTAKLGSEQVLNMAIAYVANLGAKEPFRLNQTDNDGLGTIFTFDVYDGFGREISLEDLIDGRD